jgi:Xaa-Pro aminopeptidase
MLTPSDVSLLRRYRQGRVLKLLRDLELDALLLFSIENIRYYTNFRPLISVWLRDSYACVVTSDGRSVLLANYGDLNRIIAEGSWADKVTGYPPNGRPKLFSKLLKTLNVKGHRVGFDHVGFSFLTALKEEMCDHYEFVDVSKSLDMARSVKSPTEIKIMKRCGELLGEATLAATKVAKPGLTEADVSAIGEATFRKLGAEGVSWSFASFAGKNAAIFARHDSLKVLKDGEFLILGYAGIFEGYNTDITVTIPLGQCRKKHSEVYTAAYEGFQAALEATRAGRRAKDLRDIALKVITEHGYGAYPFSEYQPIFHGIGMNVYEPPQAPAPCSDLPNDMLKVGNTIALETLILVKDAPKLGGVRVGQTIVVTENGYEPITWTWPESHFEMLER